ncbi:recombinase family protein [Shewanella olleyana]|uniref:recombinase family protein n=1 Tax=Shewanella olleyana TaxID=135626 RepID=UPI00200DF6CA|nr:recombinase family protein [Shewanella olleyana]MCL1068691.1 recombinase family protein [Shewanella olleyana]
MQTRSSMPLLYSYIRFSTVEQAKGQSLSRQMSYAKEVAKDKGLMLDDSLTMKDLGVSAFNKANITSGALGVFLKAVEKGRVPAGSILVIESLDRISRAAPLESQGVIAQIINADITVITATDGKEYNKETIKQNPLYLVNIILILIRANEESETKSLRVRSALTKQCEDWSEGKRGFRIKCGKAPKWCIWDDKQKKFTLEPREQAIMLRKIELYKKGFGGLKIAELLNKEFGKDTIHHTGANVYKEVKRRSLIGELNVNVGDVDYVLENYYPALISEEEFNFVIANSSKRGAIKHSQKFVGILSGIDVFKCGTCGKSIGSHVVYRNKRLEEVKSSHKRYGCVEARRKSGCTMTSTIQIEVIEKAVVKYCQDKVNLQRILVTSIDSESINLEENNLKSQLAQVMTEIDNLVNVLSQLGDEPPQAIALKIKKLESQSIDIGLKIKQNKNKQVKIVNTSRDEVTDRWLNLTKNLNELGGEDRLAIRQLVKDTFKSITLHINTDSNQENGLSSVFEQLLGVKETSLFDLTFVFHNDNKRIIRVDKHTGKMIKGLDLEPN